MRPALPACAALFIALAAVLASPGCRQRDRYVPGAAAKLVVVPFGLARPDTSLPVVVARLASTPEQRERGLGGRDHLDDGEGMLFVYPSESPRLFWMKDCFIGLDIAFIDATRHIANTATLPPGANLPEADIPRASSVRPALYVLETPSGWLARHGIAAGDEVDLEPALSGVKPR